MTCRQLAPDLIDYARGVALDAPRLEAVASHVRTCSACAAMLEQERMVSNALRRLADEQPAPPADARQLQRLLAVFDERPAQAARQWQFSVEMSLAASVLIVAGLAVGWNAREPLSVAPRPQERTEASFVPVAGADGLPRFERGEVIRVEMPSAEGLIQADVLVGQDGLVRAVRFVQ